MKLADYVLCRRQARLRTEITFTCALALLAALSVSCKTKLPPPRTVDETPPDYSVLATDFVQEFKTDPAAAAKKYEGKIVDVTGLFFTCTLMDVGAGRQMPSDITLQTWRGDTKLLFELERETRDKRFYILEYFTQMKIKGRYSGTRADGTHLFKDSVMTANRVNAKDYPTRATISAAQLLKAYWPETPGIDKLQGFPIEVTGEIQDKFPDGVRLKTGNDEMLIWCSMAAGGEKWPTSGVTKIKGFCVGRVFGRLGVSLIDCVEVK